MTYFIVGFVSFYAGCAFGWFILSLLIAGKDS